MIHAFLGPATKGTNAFGSKTGSVLKGIREIPSARRILEENPSLRRIQARQRKLEDSAVLAERFREEHRIMTEQIRQFREKFRKQEQILRDRNSLLQKTLDRNKNFVQRLKDNGISVKKKRKRKGENKVLPSQDLRDQLLAKDSIIRVL